MTVHDQVTAIKRSMGYSDDEVQLFLSNPSLARVAAKAPELIKRTIIAEVADSHGCLAQHHKGDQIYFNGFGHLLHKKNEKRV